MSCTKPLTGWEVSSWWAQKYPFHSFKQLYIWGFACCKIFIFSHFKECLSSRYNTVSSPGHAASSWVLCVSGRRKQYSWLMTSQGRKKIWKILHVLWLHCSTTQTIETTAGVKNSNSMSFWSSLDSSVCDYWMAACQWQIREGCCFILAAHKRQHHIYIFIISNVKPLTYIISIVHVVPSNLGEFCFFSQLYLFQIPSPMRPRRGIDRHRSSLDLSKVFFLRSSDWDQHKVRGKDLC